MANKTILTSLLAGSALLLGSCTMEDVVGSAGSDKYGVSVEDEVVMGLRTALQVGIDSSSMAASKVNGYLAHKVIKILLPEEAAQALQAAQDVAAQGKPYTSQLELIQTAVDFTPGLSGATRSSFGDNLNASSSLAAEINGLATLSDSLILYMNRAAEYAAPRSVPIFKNAITGMSITDGLSLLNSSDSTAATLYLNDKTSQPLITAYAPIVDSTLALVPLTQYWGRFRETYNEVLTKYADLLAFQQSWNGNAIVASVPALQVNKLKTLSYKPIVTASLGAYTTGRALDGLFYLVGEEEKGIRRDPFGYIQNLSASISDLLGEVFGKIMQMGTR